METKKEKTAEERWFKTLNSMFNIRQRPDIRIYTEKEKMIEEAVDILSGKYRKIKSCDDKEIIIVDKDTMDITHRLTLVEKRVKSEDEQYHDACNYIRLYKALYGKYPSGVELKEKVEQKPASKWISVDAELPEELETVLVKNDQLNEFALAYIIRTSHLSEWCTLHDHGVMDSPVTHWKYVELD